MLTDAQKQHRKATLKERLDALEQANKRVKAGTYDTPSIIRALKQLFGK